MITVLSVNLAAKTDAMIVGKDTVATGINKRPVADAVNVGELGLEGDTICNTRHHGGPDQAVYLYRKEDYEYWSHKLGRDVPYTTFGENLTIDGLSSPGLMVGDRLRFPDLELEVTAPRIPCATLAAKMGDKLFAKQFVKAGRSGFYCRVLRQGTVAAGQQAELLPYEHDSISTVTFFNDFHRKLSVDTMKRYLDLPIDARSRVYLQGEVDKAGG